MSDPVLAFDGLRRRRLASLARLEQAEKRFAQRSAAVGEAKARLSQAEPVRIALEELQQRQHARTLGAFETLLTLLLRDVFPENRSVHLDLYTSQGLPAMDINIRKDGGELEDARAATGGGVTNGLSTGLRLISLIRSGHRPFIILDEPDCWMETERVPAFARVLQQTATELGVQVLLISHHPDSMLSAIPYRLRLEQGAQGLALNWAPTSEIPVWEDDQPGLRGVLFENCYGHTTTFLPLAPGVTSLRGPNDAGKSSLVSALRAVLEGGGNDQMIRHHQDSARVTLDFGPDKVIHYERKRSGSPKVCYTLTDPSLGPDAPPLRKSTDARKLPEWLTDVTGIGPVEGLNVQMGEQKNPVFLLNEAPSQRAKALAVGSENAYIQWMIAQDKREMKEAALLVKQGEAELEALHREITALKPLLKQPERFEQLDTFTRTYSAQAQELAHLKSVGQRWRRARAQLTLLKAWATPGPDGVPAIAPTVQWRQMQRQWAAVRRQLQVLAGWRTGHVPAVPPAPAPVGQWRRWAQQWTHVQRQHAHLSAWLAQPAPVVPTPVTGVLRQTVRQWQRVQRHLGALAGWKTPGPGVQVPPVQTEGRALSQTWRGVRAKIALLTPWVEADEPTVPALSEARQWRGVVQQWTRLRTQMAQQAQVVQEALAAESLAQEALAQAHAELHAQAACPLCLRPFEGALAH